MSSYKPIVWRLEDGGGEVLKYHVKGVTGPKGVMSVLSKRGGERVSRSGWVGDGLIISMGEVGIQG